MTQEELVNILEACGYVKDDNLVTNYSGRWMFGRQCVAVHIDVQHSMKAATEIAHAAFDALDKRRLTLDQCAALLKALSSSKYDDIGMQGLIYFPEVRT